jgi:hypothetical protein
MRHDRIFVPTLADLRSDVGLGWTACHGFEYVAPRHGIGPDERRVGSRV